MGLSVNPSVHPFICWSIILLWFLYISRQAAQGIYLKHLGYIHHGTTQIWQTFRGTQMNFCCFLDSWLVKQFLHISGQIAQGIDLKLGGYIYYGTCQVWWTLSYAPLNFCHFLASDWSNSFHIFADKLLIRFSSNVVGLAWLTLGHAPWNFHCLVASHWSRSFCAFTN